MAEISKITLPNGNNYDLKVYTNHISPYQKKVYESTDYYATAANQNSSTWYFMSVRPDDWYKVWRVSFKLHTYCPNYPNVNSITFSTISGRQNGFTYMNFNDCDSVGHYYISCYPLTTAGYNAGYGHAIGNSIFYASNYTTKAYYRTFEVDLIQTQNCTVTFLETPVKWTQWEGTGTTNYGSLSNLNTSSRGLQWSGDAGVTGVKGNAESSYRSGQVNLTADNIGAFEKKSYDNGTLEAGIRPYVDQARANRLAFLPADQIIIEKTTDGGTTWQDAGVTDASKCRLFVTGGTMNIPLLNGAKSTQCGVRITITGMKYNVPEGTVETEKYNYWNATNVIRQERYFNVREWWFWLSSNNDAIRPQIYRATGANPNNWVSVFDTDFAMTGWSGSNWIRAGSGQTFGGGTSQTGNNWNWRIIFWSRYANGKTSFGSNTVQTIQQIRCYGDSVWGMSNNLGKNDHIYSYDASQNVTFPAKITATQFSGTATNASKVNNHTVESNVPANAVFTDTKNTAGSTNTSSKIFLIGATSQAANPQTYSHDTAYVGTDGKLYSDNKVVLTSGSNAASAVTITPITTDVYSMTSAGSVTLPTLTFAMDTTDTKKLKITFGQGSVTLPGRSSVIKAWTGYTAATAAAQTFTGNSEPEVDSSSSDIVGEGLVGYMTLKQ